VVFSQTTIITRILQLYFALCRTCMVNKSTLCACTDDQRSFTGSFTSFELQIALDRGYKVVPYWTNNFELYFITKFRYWRRMRRGIGFSLLENRYSQYTQNWQHLQIARQLNPFSTIILTSMCVLCSKYLHVMPHVCCRFYKVKAESSGWPAHVKTEEERQKWVTCFKKFK